MALSTFSGLAVVVASTRTIRAKSRLEIRAVRRQGSRERACRREGRAHVTSESLEELFAIELLLPFPRLACPILFPELLKGFGGFRIREVEDCSGPRGARQVVTLPREPRLSDRRLSQSRSPARLRDSLRPHRGQP